ncbi:MAG: SURF1 family protein [Burkholderiaceae bacterium]|nr:SURF1 family protein [Burkholderiaceae bacterium]
MLSAWQRRWLVAVAALAISLLTARLGLWQLDRAARKLAEQAAIEARARLPVIDQLASLADSADAAPAQHHRLLRLAGRWSAAHTVYLDNRPMNGRPGFHAVTPLLLADGSALLVQRGWLPRDFQDRSRVADVPTPDGDVSVSGRIAPPPTRLYEFSAGEGGRIRQNLDLAAFARETGLRLRPLSLLLAESPASAGDGLQRDWPAPSAGMAKNRGYAVQWFALSALILVLYVWFQLVQPYRRRNAQG